jgi:hypothetical protein
VIEEHLAKEEIPYLKLTGASKDRGRLVEDFQTGKIPLFLISLKAGGTGLNLTAADTVIHYDPWWNPAAENQATDRAYRIGQDKPVFVHKLLCQDTVEERIHRIAAGQGHGAGAAGGSPPACLPTRTSPWPHQAGWTPPLLMVTRAAWRGLWCRWLRFSLNGSNEQKPVAEDCKAENLLMSS